MAEVEHQPERREAETDGDVLAVATAYVELAGGDLRRALLEAVADGLTASRFVSRGFVRWGRAARTVTPAGVPRPAAAFD